MGRRGHVNIFFEKDLSQYLEGLRNEIKAAVISETAEYLLNVDEETLAVTVVPESTSMSGEPVNARLIFTRKGAYSVLASIYFCALR